MCSPSKGRAGIATFQVMSDLHLEVGNQYSSFHIPKTASYLILAGDIGRLSDYESYLGFLSAHCGLYQRVFLVLGNHEFYGLSHNEGLRRAELLERESELHGKLVILNRTRVDLQEYPGIILLGCTLQSRIIPEAQEVVKGRVRDFQRILGWTVDNHLAEHALDVSWLETQILQIRNDKSTHRHRIIVVSHHAPCIKRSSRPDDIEKPWCSAFATDLLNKKSVLCDAYLWIFGHTHFCTDFSLNTVRLISNQRGYASPNRLKKQHLSARILRSLIRRKTGKSDLEFCVEKTITVTCPRACLVFNIHSCFRAGRGR